MDTLIILVRIALRNLVASRLKTVIVGGIVFFGALLVVVGTSFVDTIDGSMKRSIVGSVAGHVQVYSAESKDELTVMGSMDMEAPELGQLDDFAQVERVIGAVDNVRLVVPMGINGAIVTSGNTIDVGLERLRETVRKRQAGAADPALERAYAAEKGHVRQMVTVLEQDLANVGQIQRDGALAPEDAEAVRRAATPEFWDAFDADPLGNLEFLENRIAPLATDADMLFLRYVGTDPARFAAAFDRFRIVDGATIPPGRRGFLFSRYMYEEQVKLKTALRLDKIKRARENRGATIAGDDELRRFVRENSTQVRELLLQLDGPKTARFRELLQKELGDAEADVGKLLARFFQTDDANFARRYDFFYRELAPHLDLYRVRVGDTLTIKAWTRSGYVQSINVPVYGSFEFAGLEGSPLAGDLNLMDIVSFRELYGFASEDRKQEIEALRAAIGAQEVARDRVEADLFGAAGGGDAVAPVAPAVSAAEGAAAAERALAGLAGRRQRAAAAQAAYDPARLASGTVLNAAVLVRDDSPRALLRTMAAIEDAGRRAGVPLKAISWQAASGLVGQFVTLMRGILYAAVLIIFVVALVIINNALVMATLQRVHEIGTLRAVGAQRRFVMGMLVIEALVLGGLFGTLGAVVGAAIVKGIGAVGIPAFNDIATFFFSGPRLHPQLAGANLVVALAIVMVVSTASSFYPAYLAMRVTPRQAMQSEE